MKRRRRYPLFRLSAVAVLALAALGGFLVTGVGASVLIKGGGAPSASPFSSAFLAPGDYPESLVYGGLTRTYIVHVPPGPMATDRSLILVYHGAGDTAANTIQETDFESAADAAGDIVVFLQGYDQTWDDHSGETAAELANVDDIGFTGAVLDALVPLVEYNTQRVAATGVSNGALMVETLGCYLASRLYVIVPVEGEIANRVSAVCAPSRPLNVYEIHATADPSIPYAGGVFYGSGGPVTVLSAKGSVARWAQLDGCTKGPVTTSGAALTFTHYTKCHSKVTVTLRTIIGGAHVWGPNVGTLVAAALDT